MKKSELKQIIKEEIQKVLRENEDVRYKTLVDWYYIDDNDEKYKGNKRGWVAIEKNANLDDFFPPEETWGPGSSRYSRPEPKLIVGESGYIVTKGKGSMVFKPIGYDFEIPVSTDNLKYFQKLSKKVR